MKNPSALLMKIRPIPFHVKFVAENLGSEQKGTSPSHRSDQIN